MIIQHIAHQIRNVLYLLKRDGVNPPKGPLINYWTTYGYDPVPLDVRYVCSPTRRQRVVLLWLLFLTDS
jgi:hypothetical protein